MESNIKKYTFKGAIVRFGTVLDWNYEASTYAKSYNQASTNIKHRYREENDLPNNARIKLEGCITCEV